MHLLVYAIYLCPHINFFSHQAIELASEVLANVKFIQEKKLIGMDKSCFFPAILFCVL